MNSPLHELPTSGSRILDPESRAVDPGSIPGSLIVNLAFWGIFHFYISTNVFITFVGPLDLSNRVWDNLISIVGLVNVPKCPKPMPQNGWNRFTKNDFRITLALGRIWDISGYL